MSTPVIALLTYHKLPTGRRITALSKIRHLAKDAGISSLVEALDRHIDAAETLLDDEQAWKRRKQGVVEHGQDAKKLDVQLDAMLAGLENSVKAQTKLALAFPQRAAEAERFLAAVFPDGLAAITQANFVDQSHSCRRLIKTIRRDRGFLDVLAEIGLSQAVDTIADLTHSYREAVGAGSKVEAIDRAELEARIQSGHEGLGEIVARILGLFPSESPEDAKARKAFLAPIDLQNEIMRSIYRLRSRRQPESADFDLRLEDGGDDEEDEDNDALAKSQGEAPASDQTPQGLGAAAARSPSS